MFIIALISRESVGLGRATFLAPTSTPGFTPRMDQKTSITAAKSHIPAAMSSFAAAPDSLPTAAPLKP